MSDHISSAGERAAIVGYAAQYRIAAEVIYEALLAGSLEWIAVADPAAGRVDDIQVATNGRIDAYQVKWGEQRESFSFNDLVSGDGDPEPDSASKGLIGQLAGGWQRLRAIHPTRRVVVHLISKDSEAPQAKIPHDAGSLSKANLQGFLNDCWRNREWARLGMAHCPVGWSPAIAALRQASLLVEVDFLNFISDCEIELGYILDDLSQNADRESQRRHQDVTDLAAFLFQLVGAEQREIHLATAQVLTRLGWGNRFKSRFLHEFPVDKLYQTIEQTVNELEASLAKYQRGYLALLGTPGSGKSTMLTHTLRYRKGCRVVRYYAFVPDSPYQGRGEANNFLHDVVASFRSSGISGGKSQGKTREELLDNLKAQFIELHEQWQKDGIMTIILVDGLDHIQREQNPERSLLCDLPHPDTVPDGVIFILGSQTLELSGLSPAIKTHLKMDGRQLTMMPMTRAATIALVEAAGLTCVPSSVQLEQIYRLADGHPLALSYLVQRLMGAVTFEDVVTVLADTNPYQGHIDQAYDVYWQGIESNTKFVDLLGLLARLRAAFELRTLEAWVGKEAVAMLVRQGHFYFRKETTSRWQFFHNSFRQFLIERTSRNVLDEFDEQADMQFHHRLAAFFEQQADERARSWEVLYHLSCAGDWAGVLAIATQAYFRDQFLKFRSFSAILDDITLAMRAARARHDVLAFFRLLLIEKELRERQDVLNQNELPTLIFTLNGAAAFLDFAFDGDNLRISDEKALGMCSKLIDAGEVSIARKLFDAAEPLEYLSGTEGVEHYWLGCDLLNNWAKCAFHFRPLNKVLHGINALTIVRSGIDFEDTEMNTNQFRESILEVLIDAVAATGDVSLWDGLRQLLANFFAEVDWVVALDFAICQQQRKHPEAVNALERIILWAKDGEVSKNDRVAIGEFVCTIKGDFTEASNWIKGVSQPMPCRRVVGQSWANLAPVVARIRHVRLLATIGEAIEPTIIIPAPERPEVQGYVVFERCIVALSALWGAAKNGQKIVPSEIIRKLRPSIQVFYRDRAETRKWLEWAEIGYAASDFFLLMICAVEAHGVDAIQALGDALESEWTNEHKKRYWPFDRCYQITLELYRRGDRPDRLRRQLELMEQWGGVYEELNERAESIVQIANGWHELGEFGRARMILPRLMAGTFGISYRKDRQMQQWVDLFAIAVKAGRIDNALDDVSRFAAAIMVLDHAHRGRGEQDAGMELLALAVTINPALAWTLFEWLMAKAGLQFETGVAGILLGALRTEKPPLETIAIIACHLVIPFVESPDLILALAKQLAVSCVEFASPEKAKQLLDQLNQAILVKAWPNARAVWWRGIIAGLREKGVDCTDFERCWTANPGEKDGTSPILILKDGSEVTEEDVLVLAGNYLGLVKLIEAIESTKYFEWRRVLKPIIDQFSAAQVLQVVQLLEPFKIDFPVRNQCALRLHQLGHTAEAIAILEPIISQSPVTGWDAGWDGGSRLLAIKAMIIIDPKKWRSLAVERLIDDYIAEFRSPFNMINNFEELSGLLFEETPWHQIWSEIREHVFQLAEFSLAEDVPPSPTTEALLPEEMLLKVVIWCGGLPINEIRDQVHLTFCELIAHNAALLPVHSHISAALAGKELSVEQGLAVLDTTWRKGLPFAMQFGENIAGLVLSRCCVKRHMAMILVEMMDLPRLPMLQTNVNDLPLIYQIRLPALHNYDPAVPASVITKGNLLPDLQDSIEMVRPHLEELEWLSGVADIPLENLLEQAVTVMRTIEPETAWDRPAEARIKDWLSDLGLKITYNRPRPMVALLAISQVAAELMDAGRIAEEVFVDFYRQIYLYEYRLAGAEPTIRPSVIRPLAVQDSWREDNWLGKTAEVFNHFSLVLEDGFSILAEFTKFRAWNSKTPTELRNSLICHPQITKMLIRRAATQPPFPNRREWPAQEYPYLIDVENFPVSAIEGTPWQVLIGASNWLAFNPNIALHMGWRLSDQGLFRWVDKSQDIMVESRWWEDGPMNRHSYRSSEKTGMGWLVVASPVAIRLLKEVLQDFVVLKVVKRYVKIENSHERLGEYSTRVEDWVG